MDKLGDEINQIQSTEKIQKVFRGHKARRETEQMKNKKLQNEPVEGKITDELHKKNSNKGLPVRRIKKGSRKGSKVHR